MSTPVIRKLARSDATELTRLNREFFGFERPDGFWEWKYFQLPANSHYTSVLEDQRGLVGQIGCISVYISIRGVRKLAGQLEDILILAEFRKGRALLKAEKIASGYGAELGSVLDFGFSIESTRKIATRLFKFTDVTRVQKMVFPLNPEPYLLKKLKSPLLIKPVSAIVYALMKRFALPTSGQRPDEWTIEEIRKFDTRFDRLWEKVKDQYDAIVERTSDYLNWRYIDNPAAQYTCYALSAESSLLGFIVLEIKEKTRKFSSLVVDYTDARRGEIVDILVAADPRAGAMYGALLEEAFKHFLGRNVDVISCWCLPHMEISTHLRRWRFRQRPTPHNLVVRLRVDDPDLQAAIYKPESWYLMRGDSDHY